MSMDFTRIHEQYLTSSPDQYDCIYQEGKLYTRDGRLIPHEVSSEELQRIAVPAKYQHLVHTYEQPSPEIEFDFGDLSMDELEPEEEEQIIETRHRGVRVQETLPAGAKKRR